MKIASHCLRDSLLVASRLILREPRHGTSSCRRPQVTYEDVMVYERTLETRNCVMDRSTCRLHKSNLCQPHTLPNCIQNTFGEQFSQFLENSHKILTYFHNCYSSEDLNRVYQNIETGV